MSDGEDVSQKDGKGFWQHRGCLALVLGLVGLVGAIFGALIGAGATLATDSDFRNWVTGKEPDTLEVTFPPPTIAHVRGFLNENKEPIARIEYNLDCPLDEIGLDVEFAKDPGFTKVYGERQPIEFPEEHSQDVFMPEGEQEMWIRLRVLQNGVDTFVVSDPVEVRQ